MLSKELQEYYLKLKSNFEEKTTYSVQNKDRSHNALIMAFMLEVSKSVNMYCGELSVFRNSFYDVLPIPADIETDMADEFKKEVRDFVAGCLSDFLKEDERRLNIIVRNFKPEFLDDLISNDDFRKALASKRINISKIDDNLVAADAITHFAYTDTNIMRIERNKKERSAICGVALPDDMMNTIADNFFKMRSLSKSIDNL